MTKLMEWLLFASVFLGVWTVAITSSINSAFITQWQETMAFLPLIFIFLGSFYVGTMVLYRVLTFNDCEEAATELQHEIQEAKNDLQGKGIQLRKPETSKI